MDFSQIPKVELHAHLSGSVSSKTFNEIIRIGGDPARAVVADCLPIINKEDNQSLNECFHRFTDLHRLIDSVAIVEKITVDVIDEFADDNVIYLELRTTLRSLPTKTDYLDAVIRGIKRAPSVITNRIDVRLLLSIDRARSLTEAEETISILLDYQERWPGLLVGIDVSGNPSLGNLLEFVPLLELVKIHGLRTTVHFAEIPDGYAECLAFLQKHLPNRIGHGTFLPLPTQTEGATMDAFEVRNIILNNAIPIELCLTSNVKSRTVSDYESHHATSWIRAKHPVCICTDDKGLFCSSLSGEWQQLSKHCGIDNSELVRILTDTAQSAFCDAETKSHLIKTIQSFFNPNI